MEYILKMPAAQFFAMLRASRRVTAFHYSEMCDIAYIPAGDHRYHQRLKSIFWNNFIEDDRRQKRISETPNNAIPAESSAAKDMFMAMFAGRRGRPN